MYLILTCLKATWHLYKKKGQKNPNQQKLTHLLSLSFVPQFNSLVNFSGTPQRCMESRISKTTSTLPSPKPGLSPVLPVSGKVVTVHLPIQFCRPEIILRFSSPSWPCHVSWLPVPVDLASSFHVCHCNLSPGHHLGSTGLRPRPLN